MTATINIVYWKDKTGVYLNYCDFSQDKSLLTLPSENILGKTDYDLYPATIADKHREQDLLVLDKGLSVSYEITLPDNTATLQINKQPLRSVTGETIGIIANVNNYHSLLTQYQNSHNDIKALVKNTTGFIATKPASTLDYVKYLHDHFRNIIDLIPAHVYWFNLDNTVLGCNSLQAKNLGLTSTHDVVGKTFYDLFSPEDAAELLERNQQVIAKGRVQIYEDYVAMVDGPGVYLTHKAPLKDAQQNIIGVLGISFDITDRKKAEQERLNAVLNAANMGTWSWNFLDDTFTHEYAFHEDPYSFKGNFDEAVACAHPADQKQFKTTLQQAYQNKTKVELEFRLCWPDGTIRHMAIRGNVIKNKFGKPFQMIGVSWDISKRKELESILFQQQVDLAQIARLNSIGELASTLSHELNQPLTAIANYTKGCLIRLKNGNYRQEEIITALEHVSTQSTRAEEIIHRMKNFIRKGKLYYEMADLNATIQETVNIIQLESSANSVSILLDLHKQIPPIEIDTVQISQVISNLLRNAIEAIIQNNTNNPQINIKTLLHEKNKIYVDIIDNGPGCSPEHIAKLFTPYFTTKRNGMGMGLAICRTIIEAHGGELTILPNPQSGAWFRFSLPVVNNVATAVMPL